MAQSGSGLLSGLARMATRKSTKDLGALDRVSTAKEYPVGALNYEILDDCGRGVSATVHRALCKPLNEVVAIKKMNLESLNCDLEEIIHEAQTMKNYHHPNVLPLYCSFVSGQDLWMVMPFISGGSVLHIMKYEHPDGLDEVTIATIMRDVLRALEYVHKQGGIHRDIKAGNILIDKEGHVQLGDFGVAASMERSGSWGHDKVARMTFVGTPCWMAPEVMEQTHGYDSSADIWSFGITLLELAHGHAPFAKFPPMKVLLMTLQNPPPTLDDKGKKHFSKAMREVVSRCLQKDPRLRPTASQLLEHKFFKQARDDEYIARNLMAGLPPLGERVQEIRQGTAATNASDNDKNFARSQDEYKKGISAWNFDVVALKAQAALEPDDEEPALPTIAETDETMEGTLSGLLAMQAAAFVTAQHQQQQPHSNSPSPPLPANGHGTAGGVTLATVPTPGGSGGGLSTGAPGSSGSIPHVNSAGSTNSAFACLQGQQQLLRETSASVIPPAPYIGPDGAPAVPLGSGDTPTPSEPSKPGVVLPGESGAPMSPGTVSPGLSRESSVQGPMSAMASVTPNTSKQKIKQQGRFQIYEPGSEPPPMSGVVPPAATMSVPVGGLEYQHMVTKSHPGGAMASVSEAGLGVRTSDDGARRPGLEAQESVFDGEVVPGEPKKKGRFLVVEQQGMSKVASAVSLTDSASLAVKSRSEAGKVVAELIGKPPVVPTTPGAASGVSGSAGGAMLPVAAVLPRLMELMDHVGQQQAAMQRLVAAVQEAERGRGNSTLLARAQSAARLLPPLDTATTQPVATPSSGAPLRGQQGSGGGDTDSTWDHSPADGALRSRVSELEADNARLKARVAQLEALLAHHGGVSMNGLAAAGEHAARETSGTRSAQGPSPTVSPRDDRPSS